MTTWPSFATWDTLPSPKPGPSQDEYKRDTLDTQLFREQFLPTVSREEAEVTAVALMRQLKAPVYWWNQKIKTARRDCLSARRRYQRARDVESFAERQSEYRARRKALKIAIRESKR